MTLNKRKSFPIWLLITYLISALLFLTSIDLHIHAQGGAASADQASTIHISNFKGDLAAPDQVDEISISPSGVLKSEQNNLVVIEVIIIATLIAIFCSYECVTRIRDIQTRFHRLPFYGTPLLRAPPAYNS